MYCQACLHYENDTCPVEGGPKRKVDFEWGPSCKEFTNLPGAETYLATKCIACVGLGTACPGASGGRCLIKQARALLDGDPEPEGIETVETMRAEIRKITEGFRSGMMPMPYHYEQLDCLAEGKRHRDRDLQDAAAKDRVIDV